jgi:hypothetical protein
MPTQYLQKNTTASIQILSDLQFIIVLLFDINLSGTDTIIYIERKNMKASRGVTRLIEQQ